MDLPYVLALQFVALFGMESAEQLLGEGRLQGGAAWLGGPAWLGIVTHLVVGVACTLLIACGMRTIARRCATLIVIALDHILYALERNIARYTRRRHASTHCYARLLHVRQLGERAPPLLPALT